MEREDAFSGRYGFRRGEATLANWRGRPFSRWSFQNLRELVPTAGIAAPRPEAAQEWSSGSLPSDPLTIDGVPTTADAFLQRSETDMLLVLKDGRTAASWCAPHADWHAPHILFSISKSMTALVAGILAEQGVLDLEAPVAAVMPEARGSAYGDATVRHLLDMRVSLDFEEVYSDTTGPFARYRRATLWNPADGAAAETLERFLLSLAKSPAEHGGPFRYRSPNSDFLGLVLERASGQRFASLMRRLLLEPMGATGEAFVTVDAAGTARTAGGIGMTVFDLAAVGELMRSEGAAGGRQVVPASFVHDTVAGGDAEAWKAGDMATLFPTGAYRNKWYSTGDSDGSFAAIGIHGQWLYVEPGRAVTIVKFSSQEQPVDVALDLETLAFFRTLAERL